MYCLRLVLFALSLAASLPALSAPCPDYAKLPAAAGSARLVLFGEVHGTNESPKMFGDAVCHALEGSKPIIVGLEISRNEQGMLDRFLASSGGSAEREILMQGAPWGFGDGRTSKAMLELIERIRTWRAAGKQVEILAFDGGMDDFAKGIDKRDEIMAANIARAMAQKPEARLFALAGNVHARKKPVRFGATEIVPMAVHLAAQAPVSLVLGFSGGSYWNMYEKAAAKYMDRGELPFVVMEDVMGGSYDGTYWVGHISTSPPAR